MNQAPISNPRRLAVACLLEIEKHDLLVPEAIGRLAFDLSEEQRAYAHEIIYGTFRYLPGLERVLAHFCKPKKLPPPVRWLLLSSIYQLHFMRAPDYATVNEANKLVVKLKFHGLKPLVNGVLRNVIRKGEEIISKLDDAAWLLPEWLAETFKSQYDSEMINSWLSTWRERGQTSYWSVDGGSDNQDEASDLLPHAYRVNRQLSAQEIKTRKLYVQNESSQAVAEMACRLKPESILDLCAAPGGKTCYMASFSGTKQILACDSSAERVSRMKQNRDRLDLSFDVKTADGRHLGMEEVFDLVLLDAPCSGIGIIGRHPEIKFLKKKPADEKLHELQAQLLESAWERVKPGGFLLFTVCSLDKRELPAIPEDATAVSGTQDPEFLKQLPCHLDGDRFFFSPTPVFDGFSGMLLHKAT